MSSNLCDTLNCELFKIIKIVVRATCDARLNCDACFNFEVVFVHWQALRD